MDASIIRSLSAKLHGRHLVPTDKTFPDKSARTSTTERGVQAVMASTEHTHDERHMSSVQHDQEFTAWLTRGRRANALFGLALNSFLVDHLTGPPLSNLLSRFPTLPRLLRRILSLSAFSFPPNITSVQCSPLLHRPSLVASFSHRRKEECEEGTASVLSFPLR